METALPFVGCQDEAKGRGVLARAQLEGLGKGHRLPGGRGGMRWWIVREKGKRTRELMTDASMALGR